MGPLIVEGDKITPYLNFNADTGFLAMGGLAIPEDVRSMFEPIKEWLLKYSESPKPATELEFHFEYLNTAASKMVFEIGNLVSELHGKDNCRAKILWKYNRGDIEMFELGEELIEEYFCLTEIRAVEEKII